MIIDIDYNTFRRITNRSESPYGENYEDIYDAITAHDYFIMRQTILCLAGKECNTKIKRMIKGGI
jgi:hypothetical protein